MATVQVRITRDNGSQITALRTVADVDITRMMNAASSQLGKTMQQTVDYVIDRVLKLAVAFTRDAESTRGADIPFS